MSDDRILTAANGDEDAQYEAGLRPRTLDEYIGQERVRENLHVSITAAQAAGRGARSRAVVRPAGAGKDDAGLRDRERAGRADPADGRPGDREAGRPRGDPHEPAGARGALHRRSPPDEPDDRGDPLSGDGGLRARHHDRAGPERALGEGAGAALHAHRRHDPDGPADRRRCARDSASCTGWISTAKRTSARSSSGRRGSSASPIDARRGGRDRAAIAGHAARGQPAAAPGPRLRAGARRGAHHPRRGAARAPAARGRRARLRRDRSPAAAHDHRQVRRRSGRRGEPRRRHERGARRDRGHLRAVSHPDRLSRSHAARTRGDRQGVRLFRTAAIQERIVCGEGAAPA